MVFLIYLVATIVDSIAIVDALVFTRTYNVVGLCVIRCVCHEHDHAMDVPGRSPLNPRVTRGDEKCPQGIFWRCPRPVSGGDLFEQGRYCRNVVRESK